jgi:hypothetical protein
VAELVLQTEAVVAVVAVDLMVQEVQVAQVQALHLLVVVLRTAEQ